MLDTPSQDTQLQGVSEKIVSASCSLGSGLPRQILNEFRVLQSKLNGYYLLKLQSKHIDSKVIDDIFRIKSDFSKNTKMYANQKLIMLYTQLQQLHNQNANNSVVFDHQTFAMIQNTLQHQALSQPLQKKEGSLTIPDLHTTNQKILGVIELFGDIASKTIKIEEIIMLNYLCANILPSYGAWYITRGIYRNSLEVEQYIQDQKDNSLQYSRSFFEFVLALIQDEMNLAKSYLQLPYLYEKLISYIEYTRSPYYQGAKPLPNHTELLTKELLLCGEVKRGEVKNIIGREQRTATALISELLKLDYITTDSPKGAVRLKFNLQMASFIFPKLIES